jgi:hypothetical protein
MNAGDESKVDCPVRLMVCVEAEMITHWALVAGRFKGLAMAVDGCALHAGARGNLQRQLRHKGD